MTDYDVLVGLGRRRRGKRVAAAAIALGGAAAAAALLWNGAPRPSVVAAPGVGERPASLPPVVSSTAPGRLLGEDPAGLLRRSLVQWLQDIAHEAGLGLVVAPGLDAEVAGTFRADTAWSSRLESLARVHDFDYRVGESVIEIVPALAPEVSAPPTSAVPLAASTELDAAAGNAGSGALAEPEIITRVFHLDNARAIELVEVLTDGFRGRAVAVAADPASNSLVASGARRTVAMVERVAERLDVERRRFLLDAMILEVASSARTELGVQWRIESANLGAFVDFPRESDGEGDEAGIVVASSGTYNLRARVSALEAQGRIRVISRPRIVVVEGKPASIESVRVLRVRFPDRAAVVSGSDDVNVGGDRAVEAIPVGVRLQVEPAMQGLTDIVLRIRAESSNLGQPLPPDNIPEEFRRVVDAEVVVADGETAVLGGLLQVTRGRAGAGLPYLRRVPLVGLLFGRRRVEREDQELLVLVTPRLLSPAAVGGGSR
ncbi:MAG: secretin N-terminal domain-containing protein [Candidatus Binatia bacterium]